MATKRYKVEISPAAENNIEEITDYREMPGSSGGCVSAEALDSV